MNELDSIRNGRFFSGEMFDLTTTSFNNEHGDAHNKATMIHGINLPLSKFISELTKIMASTQDDKSDKRAHRLKFLISCNACTEVAILFILYCNYLNGGGTNSTPESWTNGQYKNYMVITAAGGNIIILFAHLIANMIDSFIHMVNTRNIGTGPEWKWDIKSTESVYTRERFLPESGDLKYATYANEMFSKSFDELKADYENDYYGSLIKTFELLTKTNQLLLEGLTNIQPQNTKEELCFIIVKYFIQTYESDPEILVNLYTVAQSKISDFDFKLSPNIHPSFIGDRTYGPLVDTIERLGLNTKDSGHAGFLLLRVKTLIDCNSDDKRPRYTTEQLKKFRRDCYSKLPWPPNKIKGLFPQMMQESYLSDVPADSECWLYLNNLLEKKKAISIATNYAIDEIVKFQMAGYYKQSNPEGDKVALVSASVNVTEAVINYIITITNGLNIYIKNWETISVSTDDKGKTIREYGLGRGGAPALNHTGLPQNFSYETVCGNFKSLSTILDEDDGLVSRLACDIINYFLNYPTFNTELILDNLIVSFNKKRKELTGDESSANAKMNPSSLNIASTHPDFNASLRNINEIFTITQKTRHGYPDGIRITASAIKSDTEIGDTQLDNAESAAIQASTSAEINPFYILLDQDSKLGAGIVKTSRVQNIGVQKLRVPKVRFQRVQRIKHKSRKHKSRKHKSRKHKSRKHKSRKHKSRKHKSRKHKKIIYSY